MYCRLKMAVCIGSLVLILKRNLMLCAFLKRLIFREDKGKLRFLNSKSATRSWYMGLMESHLKRFKHGYTEMSTNGFPTTLSDTHSSRIPNNKIPQPSKTDSTFQECTISQYSKIKQVKFSMSLLKTFSKEIIYMAMDLTRPLKPQESVK